MWSFNLFVRTVYKYWVLSQTLKKSISPMPVKNNLNNIKGRTGHNKKREDLWMYMRALASVINHPWVVTSDFNSILSREEKLGGIPHTLGKSMAFMECRNDYALSDIGYTGSDFTWCNERSGKDIIWKRLDRMVCNTTWSDGFSHSSVHHFPRVGSDHCPLLIYFGNIADHHNKYFKFLNFWTNFDDFLDVVRKTGFLNQMAIFFGRFIRK